MLYNSFIGKYSLSIKFGYTKTPSINYNQIYIYIYESYNLNDRSLKFSVHLFCHSLIGLGNVNALVAP